MIWQITDGKPGHESQSQGLINALADHRQISVFDIPCIDAVRALVGIVFGSFSPSVADRHPDLIIGAGHKTHLSVLAARRAFGGKAVLLMKPTLPNNLFDCLVIPQHDRPADANNVISTMGVLNTVKGSKGSSLKHGLILIGGPSKHHGWSDEEVLAQLNQVLKAYPEVSWRATTSRRTPATMLASLSKITHDSFDVTPFEQTAKGWVRDRLKESGRVWVSEDSVSMVFESLTSGADVGLLKVPRIRKRSRVYSAVDGLRERKIFLDLDEPNGVVTEGSTGFAEADRVAEELLKRFQF